MNSFESRSRFTHASEMQRRNEKIEIRNRKSKLRALLRFALQWLVGRCFIATIHRLPRSCALTMSLHLSPGCASLLHIFSFDQLTDSLSSSTSSSASVSSPHRREGLSLFSLLRQNCKRKSSHSLLRQLLQEPTNDVQLLERRLALTAAFASPQLQDCVATLQRRLTQLPDAQRLCIRLQQNKVTLNSHAEMRKLKQCADMLCEMQQYLVEQSTQQHQQQTQQSQSQRLPSQPADDLDRFALQHDSVDTIDTNHNNNLHSITTQTQQCDLQLDHVELLHAFLSDVDWNKLQSMRHTLHGFFDQDMNGQVKSTTGTSRKRGRNEMQSGWNSSSASSAASNSLPIRRGVDAKLDRIRQQIRQSVCAEMR